VSAPLGPGYSALSRGRYSAAGEEYFLTFNLQRPQRGLCEAALLSELITEMHTTESDGGWLVRTGVFMPDHVHLLMRLGGMVTLSEVVRQYKGRLTPVLRQHQLSWQRSFFDHRLRHGEDSLPIFLYIFLNPYRAGLARYGASWPSYFCAPDDWAWFGPLTKQETPFPEWLD
jgi:putative transposase